MDMQFDKGTTKLVADAEGAPALVESNGFMVIAFCDTQDDARRIKTAVREMGFPEVNYLVAPATLV